MYIFRLTSDITNKAICQVARTVHPKEHNLMKHKLVPVHVI